MGVKTLHEAFEASKKEREIFESFCETTEDLDEEYDIDILIKFAEYAIAECNNREVSECNGLCYDCILNMARKYKKEHNETK